MQKIKPICRHTGYEEGSTDCHNCTFSVTQSYNHGTEYRRECTAQFVPEYKKRLRALNLRAFRKIARETHKDAAAGKEEAIKEVFKHKFIAGEGC